MTVVCFHTNLDPRSRDLLDAHAPGWVSQPLDRGDMHAYYWAMRRWWEDEPGDLLVVEHDIGIHARTVPDLTGCEQPWCGNPYYVGDLLLMALGCTRFTEQLKTAEPDLLAVVGGIGNDGLGAMDWRRLDVRMLDTLHRRGYEQHWHHPHVEHYHVYPPAPG